GEPSPIDPAEARAVIDPDRYGSGLRQISRCHCPAARADRYSAVDRRLLSLPRQASGERRAVHDVRQPALDLRVADELRRMRYEWPPSQTSGPTPIGTASMTLSPSSAAGKYRTNGWPDVF